MALPSNIEKEDILLDDIPEPDEIMAPEPVRGQELLWEYLDAAVDVPALERERRFIDLTPELQLFLASRETAAQVGAIAQQAKLAPEQASSLARVIRNLFTGEIPEGEFDATLANSLGMELAATRDIKSGLESILEKFRENAKRGPTPLSPTGGMRQPPSPAPPPAKPQIGAAEPAPRAMRGGGAAPAAPAEQVPETPFMIHVERDEVTPFAMPPGPPLRPQPRPASGRDEAKPVRVKVEAPTATPPPPAPPKEKPQSRVVHYSNLRTPLE